VDGSRRRWSCGRIRRVSCGARFGARSLKSRQLASNPPNRAFLAPACGIGGIFRFWPATRPLLFASVGASRPTGQSQGARAEQSAAVLEAMGWLGVVGQQFAPSLGGLKAHKVTARQQHEP